MTSLLSHLPCGLMVVTCLFILLVPVDVFQQTADLVVQTGHINEINSIAFSPDGRQILSASVDGTSKLWDTSSGREIRTFAMPAGSTSLPHFRFATFYPTGERIISLTGGAIAVWVATTGKLLRTFGKNGEFETIALSPRGDLIAVSTMTGYVKLLDAETGAVVRDLAHERNFVWESIVALAFSPDGRYVAGGSHDRSIKLWDTSTGAEVNVLNGHTHWVTAVAFSPDVKLIASVGADDTIRLWETATGAIVRTIDAAAISIAFSPDGRWLIGGGGDGSISQWEISTGNRTWSVQGHTGAFDRSINSLAVSPDGGQIVTGGGDKKIKLWDLRSGDLVRTIKDETALVTYVGFTSTGKKLVAGSLDSTVRVWDLDGSNGYRTLGDGTGEMSVFDLSPDGNVIVTSGGGIKLWNASTGALIKTIDPGFENGAPNSVTFTPDGKRLVSSNQDSQIKLWDVETGRLIRTLFVQSTMASEAGNNVNELAYSPDGKRFATVTSNGKIALWDAETITQIRPMAGRVNLSRLMFSPDGRELVGAAYYTRTLKFWNASTGDEIRHDRVPEWVHINAGGFAVSQFAGKAVQADTTGGKVVMTAADPRSELAYLVSLSNGTWVVATPEGRFDTNGDLGAIEGISWVLSDDPMTPRSLDLFMRQYFEPELLRRVLNGDQFKPLPPISEINLVRPMMSGPRIKASPEQ